MRVRFSKAMLKDIRDVIQHTLIETLQVMFCINAVIPPRRRSLALDQTVCACIDMTYGETGICLSLATSKSVISLICDKIEPGVRLHTAAMIDDVISELANIVSNQLRTSFNYQHDIMFALSLPRVCAPDCTPLGMQSLKVRFNINPENGLDLDMVYAGVSDLAGAIKP
jgi:hypothetical protein